MVNKIYDCIIIDVNNLFMRNHYVYSDKKYTVKAGKFSVHSGGILGSLISLEKLKREKLKDGGKFIFLADNATSKIRTRKDIDPDYKSNRIKQKESFYRNIDFLIRILHNYDDVSKVVQINSYEADDLVPVSIDIELEKNKESKILMVSSDMDWARCINYRGACVDWFDGKKTVSKNDFYEKFGFNPSLSSIIIYKSFHGDESDFIPNPAKGLPKKYLLSFTEEKSVKHILDNIHLYRIDDKWKEVIIRNRGRILINQELVSFTPVELDKFLFHTTNSTFNGKVLKNLFDSLGVAYTIYPELSKFVQSSKVKKDWFEPVKGKRI